MTLKPILFNTPMVQAILDGRKTQTRRVCKVSSRTMNIENKDCESVVYPSSNIFGICADFYDKNGFWRGAGKPKYQPGDILYVRETWNYGYFERSDIECDSSQWFEELSPKNQKPDSYLYGISRYIYKADFDEQDMKDYGVEHDDGTYRMDWHPSIHMPKEAARIFLHVTNVRVERLQDITTDGAKSEGAENAEWDELQEEADVVWLQTCTLRDFFGYNIWDRTLQDEENYKKYRWDANPWVWVYTFERITSLC